MTRSQTRNNVKNLENNKLVTRKNSPEQKNTTNKNLSHPSNVPRRGILKKNDQPWRMPSQETRKAVSPGLAKPQHKEPMQRKQVSLPRKEVLPVIQGGLNTNILGKIYESSVMMSLKELIAIPSVRI